MSATLNSGGNSGGFRTEPGEHLVAHTLRAEGSDASEDGTGRGVPLVVGTLNAHSKEHGHCMTSQQAAESGHLVPIGIDGSDLAYAVNGDGSRFGSGRQGQDTFVATDHIPAVALQMNFIRKERIGDYAGSLAANPGNAQFNGVWERSGVRRLTPRECERLQGFPDDWTRYGHDGKEISDSARYRMLGNSVAVPCVEWIARRIAVAPRPEESESDERTDLHD